MCESLINKKAVPTRIRAKLKNKKKILQIIAFIKLCLQAKGETITCSNRSYYEIKYSKTIQQQFLKSKNLTLLTMHKLNFLNIL